MAARLGLPVAEVRAIRALVADSALAERVALVTLGIVPLGRGPSAAG